MGYHEVLKKTVRLAVTSVIGFMLSISSFTAANADDLNVPVDETKAFVLEKEVATVAVTNPSIADVSVHNNKIVLVIGRSFGTTNIVALDSDGVPVATKRIRVTSPAGVGNVTYVRGPGIFSYSCAPRCERVSLPGDRQTMSDPNVAPATNGELTSQTIARDSRANKASE